MAGAALCPFPSIPSGQGLFLNLELGWKPASPEDLMSPPLWELAYSCALGTGLDT